MRVTREIKRAVRDLAPRRAGDSLTIEVDGQEPVTLTSADRERLTRELREETMAKNGTQLPLERMTAEQRSGALESLYSLLNMRARIEDDHAEAAKATRKRLADLDEEMAGIRSKLAQDDAAEEAARK